MGQAATVCVAVDAVGSAVTEQTSRAARCTHQLGTPAAAALRRRGGSWVVRQGNLLPSRATATPKKRGKAVARVRDGFWMIQQDGWIFVKQVGSSLLQDGSRPSNLRRHAMYGEDPMF